MSAYSGDWKSLVDDDEHARVVRVVTAGLSGDDLSMAILAFRCGREEVRCKASDVDDVRRGILEQRIAERLLKMFKEVPGRRAG
jgi:hypothetical protein